MADMKSIQDLMNLKGRKALVTGGSGHLGRATCDALFELGAEVAILDFKIDKAQRGLKLHCDLRNESATRSATQTALKELGGLDILIHAAAYVGETKVDGWAVPFEQQTVSAWDEAMRVNLTSAFVLVQETKEALTASGHGSVIFFGSIYGQVGPVMSLYEGTEMKNPVGYHASKGGLLHLTRYFSTFLAPKVRVNAVSPGGVWRHQPEVFHQRYKERTPMGRMATEEDLKGAVAYLASDLSAYVTGQNIFVDGGWTAW